VRSEPPQRTGEIVGGRYRIDELLGEGGQGIVFGGTDLKDGDQVALKVLAGEKAHDPEWRERTFREMQALVRLGGTAAVRILDQQWSDRGELCLVMERLHGMDFADYLSSRKEPMGLAELVSLLDPVAKTLEIAHEAGIVHRDLKPENLFVTTEGKVRVLDFGFVRFVARRGLTRPGLVAGSPNYIAPEAWSGSPNFDRRIDVYALGALVFRALAGMAPFQSKNPLEIFRAATSASRPSLRERRPDLPPEIDDWVEHALAIQPEERFARVGAMWTALTGLARR
jgi:eukaryotic-like serine/threonine-protein kinase